MQSINVAIINPLFLAVFFGTAAACVLVMIGSLLRWHDPGTIYLLIGGALYLVGTFLVTLVFNVSKNKRWPRSRRPKVPVYGLITCRGDSLEPRSGGSGACSGGIAHHRALLFSSAIVIFYMRRK